MWDIGHKSSQDTMARKVDRVQHRRNVLVRIRVRLSSEAADNLTVTWTECNHVFALPVAEHLLWDIFQAFSVHFGRRQELNKWNWDGGNWTTNSPPSYSITVEMYFSVPCCLCAYKWLFWTQRPLNFWLETGSRMLQVNMFTTSTHTHTHTHTHNTTMKNSLISRYWQQTMKKGQDGGVNLPWRPVFLASIVLHGFCYQWLIV